MVQGQGKIGEFAFVRRVLPDRLDVERKRKGEAPPVGEKKLAGVLTAATEAIL